MMFKSKKFWYGIAAVIVPTIAIYLGIPEEQAFNMAYAIIALILGQGIADFGKHRKIRTAKRSQN